ncbi:histone deacetylase [Acinetobacter sp. ANC 4633]|uniref:histone deacetylase n=1 Tax=Acinetobacter sp. ANC 4633 TaxID=2529845 RepID=UPI00103F4133|nr:histone deacetylase [Acinetobacter sp. ANC 4633]TCB28023.1 histone deacetylase [Acinetobacter sp. ANC 4633]
MIHVCYSSRYYAKTHTNSMEKLTAVAQVLQQKSYIKMVEPDLVDIELLKTLHDPQYVEAFLQGEKPLARAQGFKQWNEQLRDAVLSVQGGQLAAAELALLHGIAANIAQGFHHAVYERGLAYCTFNGLALVAQHFPKKKIFILDCDQHGGNGTAEFTLRLANLFNYSIFAIPFGCAHYERSLTQHIDKKQGSFEEYAQAIQQGFKHARAWGADLIVYQAGMDCHQNDRFGSDWFTTALLKKRDHLVFSLAKQNNIPLMFVLAGGYQPLAELVPLHVNTFDAAYEVYAETTS